MRLPISHNYGPIWLIDYFSHPSLIWRPCSLCSLWNFAAKLTMRKLVMGLSFSEDRVIVAGVILTQSQHVIDRQTDGRIYDS